jgi:hypothetical protein
MKTAARVAPAAEVREFPDYRGDFYEKTLVAAVGGEQGCLLAAAGRRQEN